MRKTLLAAAICCSLFTACSSSDSSIDRTSFDSSIVDKSKIVNNVNPVTANPVSATPATMQVLPGQVGQPATVPATVQPVTSTTTAPGMNPPHGQPGHRCDIAVGAPLNSPVAKTTATTPGSTTPVISSSQPTVAANTATPVKTAPGMNPPHGQPNHRCDIAVGAPLNSAPAAANTVVPVKAPEVKPAITPALDTAKQ